MGTQNKWGGTLGKSGDSASGGKNVQGSNVYKMPPTAPQPKANSSTSNNVIKMPFSPGDSYGTQTISSHNSINAFTRGIKSRGPYGGPTFASLNNSEKAMQSSNTSSISKFTTPSGSTNSTVGGSGRGLTKNPATVGSGKNAGQRQSSPKSNKDGSGYMASV